MYEGDERQKLTVLDQSLEESLTGKVLVVLLEVSLGVSGVMGNFRANVLE